MPKSNLEPITSNKHLFDALLKLSTKPLKSCHKTSDLSDYDDCNDNKTRQRKSADTLD